jgi:hypothetical protein
MGFVGYSMRSIGWMERVIYVVVGALLLTPNTLLPDAVYFNVAGALLGAGLIAREYALRARARRATSLQVNVQRGGG